MLEEGTEVRREAAIEAPIDLKVWRKCWIINCTITVQRNSLAGSGTMAACCQVTRFAGLARTGTYKDGPKIQSTLGNPSLADVFVQEVAELEDQP